MDDLSSIDFSDKKMLATVTAAFFGVFGIHKFVLGYKKEGLIMLLSTLAAGFLHLTWIVIPILFIISLAEAAIYFQCSRQNFNDTYLRGHKGWF